MGAVSNTELSEFLVPHRGPGGSSLSFLQSIIGVPKQTHRVFFGELAEVGAEICEFSLSKQSSRNNICPMPSIASYNFDALASMLLLQNSYQVGRMLEDFCGLHLVGLCLKLHRESVRTLKMSHIL